MNPQFTVEAVEVDWRGRAYVRATMIHPETFSVSAGARLGGARLNLEEFTEPQLGVFRFRLESPVDATNFGVGDVVTLEIP